MPLPSPKQSEEEENGIVEIQESGYVIVSPETVLSWQKCCECKKIFSTLWPITVLNGDPCCSHCGHFNMGTPLPSLDERIEATGDVDLFPWRNTMRAKRLERLKREEGNAFTQSETE